MDIMAENGNQLKHLGHQMHNQNSPSTQSTGQPHQEVSETSDCNNHEQHISSQSGIDQIGILYFILYFSFNMPFHCISLKSAFSPFLMHFFQQVSRCSQTAPFLCCNYADRQFSCSIVTSNIYANFFLEDVQTFHMKDSTCLF